MNPLQSLILHAHPHPQPLPNQTRSVQMFQRLCVQKFPFGMDVKLYTIQEGKRTRIVGTIPDFPQAIAEYYSIHCSERKDTIKGVLLLKSGYFAIMKMKHTFMNDGEPTIKCILFETWGALQMYQEHH